MLGHVAQELAKAKQEARGIAFETPSFAGNLCSRKRRRGRGRFLSVVEDLVETNVHGARESFECVNGGDGVTVFDARNVAAAKAGALLEVRLREMLFLANGT